MIVTCIEKIRHKQADRLGPSNTSIRSAFSGWPAACKMVMSQVKRTASFEIDQPVAELFPLFSAEGEKSWVPGWEYENVMEIGRAHV